MISKWFNQRNWHRNSIWRSPWAIALSGVLGVLLWLGVLPMQARAIASPANVGLVSEVQVHLGDASESLKFVPDHLEFTAGRKYKLILLTACGRKKWRRAVWKSRAQSMS